MKNFLLLAFALLFSIMLIWCTKNNETEESYINNGLTLEEYLGEDVSNKTESLTFEDLGNITQTNFPTSSTYTQVDLATEATTTWENLYMEDTPHNLTNITPHFGTIVEQKLLSSGIEDGMIYTNFDVTFDNGTTGNVLYINNPETLDFVAATVESEGSYINYQFVY